MGLISDNWVSQNTTELATLAAFLLPAFDKYPSFVI